MCASEAPAASRRPRRAAPVLLALAVGAGLLGCQRAGGPVPAASEPPDTGAQAPSARFPGRDPSLRWDPQAASLHVAYVEDAAGGPRIAYRRLGEEGLGPVTVSPAGAAVSSHAEVPPVVEALPGGTLLVAYTVSLPGKWKGEIHLQRSTDGGRRWSDPVVLHDDGGRGDSHSFVHVALGGRGEAVFAWLDDRDGRQGLVVAETVDGRAVRANRVVDDRTCECCGTALLAGPGGRLWLAYRDLDERSMRDIALATSTDDGASFAEPTPVSADGWELAGCPHSGPRLAWADPDALWVSWFTGAGPGVFAAVSRDGGRTFAPRELVAAPGAGVSAVAHPEIAALPDGRVVVLYEATRGDGGRGVEARTRHPSGGGWSDARPLASGAVYPRFARRGERAALGWTRHAAGGATTIEVVDWRRALAR
jgi:hypothetical protein